MIVASVIVDVTVRTCHSCTRKLQEILPRHSVHAITVYDCLALYVCLKDVPCDRNVAEV